MANMSVPMQMATSGMGLKPPPGAQLGGLGAMQAPPQQGGTPPNMQAQQTTGAALAAEQFEENVASKAEAANYGDREFAQKMMRLLEAGLPSQQELGRANQMRQQAMMQQLEMLKPEAPSVLDAAMAGLAAPLDPRLLQKGYGGSAMAAMGNAASGNYQQQQNRELQKAQAMENELGGFVDKTNQQIGKTMQMQQRLRQQQAPGVVTRQLPDGTIVVLDKISGQEVRRVGPGESKQFASFFETFMKIGAEKGDYTDMNQLREWATAQAVSALGQSQNAAGAGQAPPQAAPPRPTPTAPEGIAEFNIDMSAWKPQDKLAAQRVIERYQANPNPGTLKAAEQTLAGLAAAQGPSAAPIGMPRKDVVVEAGRKTTSEAAADMYAKSFDETVLKPAAAMSNTGKIMQDFNNLSQMQGALKAGKLKEFMAGETGKWAMSFLPESSDLRKGIANAQEAEKLTASMVNQILMAAKGVQTEGDAQRARSQVTQIGADPDANRYLEAYINETARQLKLREQAGRAHKNTTGTFEGYDDVWQSSPFMRDAKGSVKRLGDQWIGLTQYADKFKAKNPGATDADAVASWNRVK